MLFIRSCETEPTSIEGTVGCLLVFDDTGDSVVDSISLNPGKNYIFNSIQSVFEPENNNKNIISVKKRGKNDNIFNVGSDNNYHAIIHFEDGEFFIQDNNSIKGTYRKTLNSKIKPDCKYEITSGDHIYFGDLKTKLISYDNYDKTDTPKWRNKVKNDIEPAVGGASTSLNEHINSREDLREYDIFKGNILENEESQIESKIAAAGTKNAEYESGSFGDFLDLLGEGFDKENENSNICKKRRNCYSITDLNSIMLESLGSESDSKKVVLLWTGCTPSSKETELIKNCNISILDSDDFDLISERVTHVIASSIKRTLKFLWAVSRGLPIISPTTLRSILSSIPLNKSSGVMSFHEFNAKCMENLLLDLDGEKKFGFSLKKSINKVQRNGPVFSGYKFFIFKSVKIPSINEINWLLESGNSAQLIPEYESVSKVKDGSKVIIIGTNSDSKIVK
ncbi:swift like BRCT domain [Cryptosporidium ryanae]|uniref:swift like BRCT domain n=1 Tax=Cryptosporidium ryanae TaxID=515981 RepID=UPI00351A0D23|nr:swift like BRCT domain [Cryptosporidium ryanae]